VGLRHKVSLHQARELLRCSPDPGVAFVGPVSRTHRGDISVMACVMQSLAEARTYRAVRGGLYGFDLWVGACIARLGLPDCLVGPRDREYQLSRKHRPLEMLNSVCLVVAFPVEDPPYIEGAKSRAPKAHSTETADSVIIPAARSLGVPLLVVRRDWTLRWE